MQIALPKDSAFWIKAGKTIPARLRTKKNLILMQVVMIKKIKSVVRRSRKTRKMTSRQISQ